MGAWDATSFGNDMACDWAFELEETDDLALIEKTLESLTAHGNEYIEAPEAEEAIAAAEALAWLMGHKSELNPYTEPVAKWVAKCRKQPTADLVFKALSVLERIRTTPSELLELWEGDESWSKSLDDLKTRLSQ